MICYCFNYIFAEYMIFCIDPHLYTNPQTISLSIEFPSRIFDPSYYKKFNQHKTTSK